LDGRIVHPLVNDGMEILVPLPPHSDHFLAGSFGLCVETPLDNEQFVKAKDKEVTFFMFWLPVIALKLPRTPL
jgi:hypothetical protein